MFNLGFFDLQGEFVNLDKIDEEEDLDPVSDDEQIQIRIEDVKPTVPVNINKKGALMTIGSESSIQVRTRFLNLNHFHEGVDGDVANGGQVAQVRIDHVDVAQDLPRLHLTVHEPGEQILECDLSSWNVPRPRITPPFQVNMHRIGSDLSFSSKKGRPRQARCCHGVLSSN